MDSLGNCPSVRKGNVLKLLFKPSEFSYVLSKAGSNLILLARRAEALQKVVDACKETNATAKIAGIQVDVADRKQVHSLWDKIPQELRAVDVLGQYARLP